MTSRGRAIQRRAIIDQIIKAFFSPLTTFTVHGTNVVLSVQQTFKLKIYMTRSGTVCQYVTLAALPDKMMLEHSYWVLNGDSWVCARVRLTTGFISEAKNRLFSNRTLVC